MVDVGAHQGTTLEPYLAAGFEVHAFEPLEANRVVIEERFGEAPGLLVRGEAVSRASGSGRLHLALRPEGGAHDHYHSLEEIGTDGRHRKGETVPVATVSIDDLVAAGELPGSVGVLKIDTEGHDLAVLEGASSLACEVVSVEFWGPRHDLGPSPSPAPRLVELMAARGYGSYIVIEHAGGASSFRFSDLEQVGEASWGNIVFFAEGSADLHAAAVAWCERGGVRGQSPLQRQLVRLFPGRGGVRFCDVGAFRGDFAAQVLEALPGSRGVLFEPAEESFELLRERFAEDDRIELRGVAVGDSEGSREFAYAPEAPATSGLLEPRAATGPLERRAVEVSTIDEELGGDDALDLLKVDTQGHDLMVLEGAGRTLAEHSPVLVVETIFVPLYEGQAPPHEILAFLDARGYRLVRMLDVHHTTADEIAFADLVLARAPAGRSELAGPFPAWDADDAAELRRQLRDLKHDLRSRRETIEKLRAQRDSLRARRGESAPRSSKPGA
jgi:FkbM family methyltransferase